MSKSELEAVKKKLQELANQGNKLQKELQRTKKYIQLFRERQEHLETELAGIKRGDKLYFLPEVINPWLIENKAKNAAIDEPEGFTLWVDYVDPLTEMAGIKWNPTEQMQMFYNSARVPLAMVQEMRKAWLDNQSDATAQDGGGDGL